MTLPELEVYFANVELPTSIAIDGVTVIADVPKFVETHLSYLRNNPGNRTYLPYYDRLMLLKDKLSTEKLPWE